MTITEFLNMIRKPYADKLARAASSIAAHVEPAFRQADGSLATEGQLDIPSRADLIPTEGPSAGQSVTIDSDSRVTFEQITVKLGKTSVVINPFTWERAVIEVSELDHDQVFRTVRSWFMDWFDIADQNSESEEGLYGVVHFVSDPETTGNGGWRMTADLGSSPARAVEDLMCRFAEAGAKELSVA